MTSDPHDRPGDPFYDGKPAWEARGDIAPNDHTDWETVEMFKPKHRWPKYADGEDLAWERSPVYGPAYEAHTPRHRRES